MTHRLRSLVMALALAVGGTLPLAAQSPDASRPFGIVVGVGLGFGTSGVHQDGRGDSKPGEYLSARVGLARHGKPLVILEVERQPFGGPTPLAAGTTTKTEFTATSLLAGLVLSPGGEFYVSPRVGTQSRTWSGPAAASFSENGLALGLDLGYHLSFGGGFVLAPEAFYRYASIDGPDNPSARGIGFRLVAQWIP